MRRRQRGVALALVVWFVAGMTLLVAGIVAMARVDTRFTSLHLARAKAVAAGDGAIQLAMLARVGDRSGPAGQLVAESLQRIGEVEVRVRIYPAAAFVDTNSASPEVLAGLFRFAAHLEPGEANSVADNVVKWRDQKPGNSRAEPAGPRRFYSLEDMLRVEGVTRTLLDDIRDYAVAGDWAPGAMNWDAAQQALQPLVDSIKSEPAGGARERSGATGGQVDGNVFRADALVNYGGRIWLRRRWLRLGGSRDSSLPWRVVRTEAPRVVKEEDYMGMSNV